MKTLKDYVNAVKCGKINVFSFVDKYGYTYTGKRFEDYISVLEYNDSLELVGSERY